MLTARDWSMASPNSPLTHCLFQDSPPNKPAELPHKPRSQKTFRGLFERARKAFLPQSRERFKGVCVCIEIFKVGTVVRGCTRLVRTIHGFLLSPNIRQNSLSLMAEKLLR